MNAPWKLIVVVIAAFLAIGISNSRGATVQYEASNYLIGLNQVLAMEVEIVYDAGESGDLFSFGFRARPEPFTPFTAISITPATPLDFDGVLGPPAVIDIDPAVLGVKGTVDVFAVPFEAYDGSLLATIRLTFQAEGVYQFGLDFFNTLGPTEQIFVAGDGTVLDPAIAFGTTLVTVIPEPSRLLLILCGLTGVLVPRRRPA